MEYSWNERKPKYSKSPSVARLEIDPRTPSCEPGMCFVTVRDFESHYSHYCLRYCTQ